MSKQNEQINDDLTTDATPSPPRDEVTNKKKDKPVVNDDDDYQNTSYKIPKSTGFTKSMGFTKPRKPNASATIINISGSNGIHIGSNYNMYMNNKPENLAKNNRKEEIDLTDEIKELLTSSRTITKDHILFIAPHFKENWHEVARDLNYSEGQISQFRIDHIASGIKEVIIQFLLDWMRNEDNPTVAKLCKALWENNHKDVVKNWSKTFRN